MSQCRSFARSLAMPEGHARPSSWRATWKAACDPRRALTPAWETRPRRRPGWWSATWQQLRSACCGGQCDPMRRTTMVGLAEQRAGKLVDARRSAVGVGSRPWPQERVSVDPGASGGHLRGSLRSGDASPTRAVPSGWASVTPMPSRPAKVQFSNMLENWPHRPGGSRQSDRQDGSATR